jgi:hypothetical protein
MQLHLWAALLAFSQVNFQDVKLQLILTSAFRQQIGTVTQSLMNKNLLQQLEEPLTLPE